MGQKSRDFWATYSNQFSFVRAEQPQMLPLPRSYLMNHVRLLYIFGMAFLVKQNKATDPLNVGFLGLVRIVLDADGIADTIEQFLGGSARGALSEYIYFVFEDWFGGHVRLFWIKACPRRIPRLSPDISCQGSHTQKDPV
jgi:hypothetical protein